MNNFSTASLSRYRDFRFRDKLRIFIHYSRLLSYRLQKNRMDRKNHIPLIFLSLKEVSLSKRPNDYKISQNRILIFLLCAFEHILLCIEFFRVNKTFPFSERVKV